MHLLASLKVREREREQVRLNQSTEHKITHTLLYKQTLESRQTPLSFLLLFLHCIALHFRFLLSFLGRSLSLTFLSLFTHFDFFKVLRSFFFVPRRNPKHHKWHLLLHKPLIFPESVNLDKMFAHKMVP